MLVISWKSSTLKRSRILIGVAEQFSSDELEHTVHQNSLAYMGMPELLTAV